MQEKKICARFILQFNFSNEYDRFFYSWYRYNNIFIPIYKDDIGDDIRKIAILKRMFRFDELHTDTQMTLKN